MPILGNMDSRTHTIFCCNPFEKSGHRVDKNLRTVTDWMCNLEFNIKPDMRVCNTCRIQLGKERKNLEVISEQSEVKPFEATIQVKEEVLDPEYDDYTVDLQNLNKALEALGGSAIKPKKVRTISYCEEKVENINQIVGKILIGAKDSKNIKNCDSEIISNLKLKFKCADENDKYRILTILPESWPCSKIEAEFGVTNYMARKAKALFLEKGVMSIPDPKFGNKTLSEDVINLVKNFYESDEVSRLMPGKKDYVSMKDSDNKRIHVQKRLILGNLREIYVLFKMTYENLKIGFSKFAELRPKNCVLAGGSGTHVVCVCIYHQNVKLMMKGGNLGILLKDPDSETELSYENIISMVVCSKVTADCYLGNCKKFPGLEKLKNLMTERFDKKLIESVTCRQWVSVDRCSYEIITRTSDEFIEHFCDQILVLKRHHFISKQQSTYFSEKKKNLKNEILISCDFAENYTFVVQDEAQSYHWNNSMATVHPFVVYYINKEDKVDHLSLVCISDCLQHDTILVHVFQNKVISWLKGQDEFKNVNKIYYFSDGASSQYKNRKNFANLCFHKSDFDVEAEWHFHATSHGKGACDGVGGTVKRLAARASLQLPPEKQILNPTNLFDWAVENIKGITFFYATKEEYEKEAEWLNERLEKTKTIVGTHQFHCYIPTSEDTLNVKFYSEGKYSKEVGVFK